MHCPQSNLKAIKLRLRLVYSLDVFSVTCGRSGVGSITTIDVHIDGTDGWLFNWIEIETGFETSRFEGNVFVDDHETLRFFRSPMNARKSSRFRMHVSLVAPSMHVSAVAPSMHSHFVASGLYESESVLSSCGLPSPH